MNNKLLKASLVLSTSALTAMVNANDVVVADGYSPLSLTADHVDVSTDFETIASLDGFTKEGLNSSACRDDSYTTEQCLSSFDITLDNGHINIINREITRTTILGDLPFYGYGPSAQEARVAALFGLIPGAQHAGYIGSDPLPTQATVIPGSEVVPLADPTSDFNASVDFVMDNNSNEDYFQAITFGSSRANIFKQASGDEVIFVSAVNGTVAEEYHLKGTTLPTTTIPEGTWLTYSVNYDASAGTLTHRIQSRDDAGASFALVYTETDIFPQITARPLVTGGSLWGTNSYTYVSDLQLDNYQNSQQRIDYLIDYSPLKLDTVSYDNTGANILFSPMITVNGAKQPYYGIQIDADNTKVPTDINGAIGKDLNIALVSHSGYGVRYTMINQSSAEELMAVYGPHGFSLDAYYPAVYEAQGKGLDYKINSGLTPEEAAVETVAEVQVIIDGLANAPGNSLNNKLADILTLMQAGDYQAAKDAIAPLRNQINAQTGKKIPSEDAAALLTLLTKLEQLIDEILAA